MPTPTPSPWASSPTACRARADCYNVGDVASADKPSATLIAACVVGAVVSMMAGVYFGGTGRLPLAMAGAGLFVLLGGLAFELARRRST